MNDVLMLVSHNCTTAFYSSTKQQNMSIMSLKVRKNKQFNDKVNQGPKWLQTFYT
jgi:hypothetical protein